MTDDNNSPPQSAGASRRRSSFAGQAFADLFNSGRRTTSEHINNSPPNHSATGPGSISNAAAQASRRRMSLTTLGLSTSPNQGFYNTRTRGDSISSSNNTSVDEEAIDDSPPSAGASQPATPFARRVSFGARALRESMNKGGSAGGNTGGGGGASAGAGAGAGASNGRSSYSYTITEDVAAEQSISGEPMRKTSPVPPINGRARGDSHGFNWADNMLSRAERSSIGGAQGPVLPNVHHRTRSVPATDQPIRAAPKPAPVLDSTQERILKGDFYMD